MRIKSALKLADAFGIAPNSSALQADADLSQLNVHNEIGGTERIRTVIVFVDSEVHTPFCHGPKMGGSAGFEPALTSFTVRCFAA